MTHVKEAEAAELHQQPDEHAHDDGGDEQYEYWRFEQVDGNEAGVGAGHDGGAVGEVEATQDPEEQREAAADERVEAAVHQAVDELLRAVEESGPHASALRTRSRTRRLGRARGRSVRAVPLQ